MRTKDLLWMFVISLGLADFAFTLAESFRAKEWALQYYKPLLGHEVALAWLIDAAAYTILMVSVAALTRKLLLDKVPVKLSVKLPMELYLITGMLIFLFSLFIPIYLSATFSLPGVDQGTFEKLKKLAVTREVFLSITMTSVIAAVVGIVFGQYLFFRDVLKRPSTLSLIAAHVMDLIRRSRPRGTELKAVTVRT